MKKNEIYKVNIESYNSEADGVARIDGQALFVPFTKIGETHEVKILKATNTAVWAKTINELHETDCPYFYKCGGCDCRHMSYAEELEFKLNKVNNALKHIGKQTFNIDSIIPADNILRYRNKAVFNVDFDKFGFYRERSHDLIKINDCLLQSELSVSCAKSIVKQNINGSIKKIFVRDTVCTIISDLKIEPVYLDGITGLVNCVIKGRENSFLDGTYYTLYGDADLNEQLCGNHFIISPKSFYQINPAQAEKLYYKALEYAGEGDTAVELYCGAGTISMLLAKKFTKVLATEIVPEAVKNAKNNAILNNVDNIEFICADASDINCKADVVVVDPPRKGLSIETINSIKRCNPESIVYVSCNPATLARDIFLLDNYRLIKGTAVDMFPRTKHVESVVKLERKDVKSKDYIEIGIDAEDYYRIKNKGNNKL